MSSAPPDLIVDRGRPIPDQHIDDTLVNLLGYAWNKMYRRTLLTSNNLRFREGVSLVEDVIFNADALVNAHRVALLNDAFVHYVQRPRITLGTQSYPDLLNLRLQAVQAVESTLSALGGGLNTRMAIAARMSQTSLIMAVRSAARQGGSLSHATAALQHLLAVDGASTLHTIAQGRPPRRIRDALTLTLLRRGHARAALLAMRAAVFLGSTRPIWLTGRFEPAVREH